MEMSNDTIPDKKRHERNGHEEGYSEEDGYAMHEDQNAHD